MKQTIKIFMLLALMVIGAGQAWAGDPTYTISQGTVSGGEIDFYANEDFGGLIDEAEAGSTVYIWAYADGKHSCKNVTFNVQKSGPSSQAEARTRTPGMSSVEVSEVDGKPGMYSFTMPVEGSNVTVSAVFPEKSQTTGVKYLDATGSSLTTTAYQLDGTEIHLGVAGEETWYVAKGTLAYSHTLRLYGDVHLILEDDAQMTITRDDNNNAITGGSDAIANMLSIYAQSKGSVMGSLSATCSNGDDPVTADGIRAGSITINGGKINATGWKGLYATGGNNVVGDVTINGGEVTARAMSGEDKAIYAGNIVTINGGQVKAVLYDGDDEEPYTIYGSNGITLGWTNATDYIIAGTYEVGTGEGKAVKTAEGKPMIAYTPAASQNDNEKQAALIQGKATLNASALAAIAGKTLRPATADDVSLTYLDWDATEKKLVSRTTATDDITDNDIVYVLQGGEATTLNKDGGTTWYVAKGEVSYTGTLTLNGDAHLILADEAAMTVGTTNSPINGNAISGDHALSIYSQGGQDNKSEGKLTAYATNSGINIDDSKNLTINGGQVTATVTGLYGIYANGDVTINGGQVIATGVHGIFSDAGDITLGWTAATDYIKASSYRCANSQTSGKAVKVADGKRFRVYDGDNAIGYTTTSDVTPADIAGKTLKPLDGYTVSVASGITLSGKSAPDFTITTGEGDEAVTTPYYIYKADDEVTLNHSDAPDGYADDDFVGFTAKGADGKFVKNLVTTGNFTMPEQDLFINEAWLQKTTYVDAEGTRHRDFKAIPLTGAESTLAGGWYVVSDNVRFDNDLTISGDAHLILGEGSEMALGVDYSLNATNLLIYGQGGQTEGQLIVPNGIYASNYTQYAGHVEATENGIYASYGVTIRGGQVKAESINANTITLGWTRATDYILADDYSGTVMTDRSRIFTTDNNEDIYGTLSADNIKGETLKPGGVTYIAANGSTQPLLLSNENVKLLDGSEITLQGDDEEDQWFVASGHIDYDHLLSLINNVHLVLTEGSEMAFDATDEDNIASGNLFLYGQGGQTEGRLIAPSGIHASNYTQFAGHIETTEKGISATNVIIRGGQVEAESIDANTITLGWTRATDYIKAGSYPTAEGKVVKTDWGRIFTTTGTDDICGTLTASDVNGKKLTPGGVTYIAADGQRKHLLLSNENVKLLDGSENSLNGNDEETETAGEQTEDPDDDERIWYIATGKLRYNHNLSFGNDFAHLVLTEGSEMALGVGYSLNATNLLIYGQGGQTEGRLIIYKDIQTTNYTQYAGYVEGGIDGIRATKDVTILGGQLSANRIEADNITLGWSRTTDYIRANSYVGTVKTNNGRSFTITGTEDIYGILSADDIHGKLVPGGVSYIAADGQRKRLLLSDENVTLLDGSENELDGQDEDKWFVATSHIDYDHLLSLINNVHLVLTEGSEMAFSEVADMNNIASGNLFIYGQGGKTEGRLIAPSGIDATNYTQYAGHVEATENGISATDNVTIRGGQVEAETIEASTITLGWSRATDYIQVNDYSANNVLKTDRDRSFTTTGTDDICGTLTASDVNGQKLTPGGISYIAADGQRKRLLLSNENVKLLDGSEDSLDGNDEEEETAGEQADSPDQDERIWYIATGKLRYNHDLSFGSGFAHLVLTEGSEMTFVEGYSLNATDLLIYGQGGQTEGRINAPSHIHTTNYTQYAGYVETGIEGISANNNVTIRGGQVKAESINANTITLGWTRATDYIKVNSYPTDEGKVVRTDWGRSFTTDNNDDIYGILDADAIEGKTLTPGGVTYIAANGKRQRLLLSNEDYVILLDGNENSLVGNGEDEETDGELANSPDQDERVWYIATGHIDYDYDLSVSNNVHLVLTDGSEIALNKAEDYSIHGGNLLLYGQGGKTEGRLIAPDGIHTTNYTQYAGHVEATENGISATTNVAIRGGQVEAESIDADAIILGWSRATDYIQAESYSAYNMVNTDSDRGFLADDKLIYGTNLDVGEISNKQLLPGSVSYIAADGQRQQLLLSDDNVTLLDGSETTLEGDDEEDKWFVASGHIDYDHLLSLVDNVNLVLTEGSEMEFSEADDFKITGDNLFLYGQGGQTEGRLIAPYGIRVSNYTQYAGHVEATENGISATTNVAIRGGQVEAESIDASTITLGWTRATDYILADDYSGTVMTDRSRIFTTDNNEDIYGTLSADNIKGETLKPGGITYIAANGSTQPLLLSNENVTLLNGSEVSLDGNDEDTERYGEQEQNSDADERVWFIATGHIDYEHELRLNYNVHLVLTEGSEMAFDATDNYSMIGDNLLIYGQGGETEGRLIAPDGINVDSYTQYAGHVNTGEYDIYASNDIAIRGGQVEAESIDANTITLGWTRATDYIKAGSYPTAEGKVVKTGWGRIFTTTETDDICGTLTASDVNGKKLTPGGVTYIAADGQRKHLLLSNENVKLLDGSENSLNGNDEETETAGEQAEDSNDDERIWYIATGKLRYNHDLSFGNDFAHLVLTEGSEMALGVGYSLYATNLLIYGQGGQTEGRLIIYKDIQTTNYTQYAGYVEGGIDGISATNNVTILGGQLSANRIEADNITLGWSRATDYIWANSYVGTVKTNNGRSFTITGTEDIYGILSADDIHGKLKPGGVSYIADDGQRKRLLLSDENVTLLDGSENELDGQDEDNKWFVATSHIDYDHLLLLNNNVHLVLTEGSEMAFSEVADMNNIASGNLFIYGQGGETEGRLIAPSGINVQSYTQYAGHVDTSEDYIHASSDVTILGGQVMAGTIYAVNVTLGWTRETDYIQAGDYDGTVKVKDGQVLKTDDGTLGIANTLTEDEVTNIASKKLVPTEVRPLFMASATNEWMTWCSTEELFVPKQCTAFSIVGIDGGEISVESVDGNIIPAYKPVLISRVADDEPLAETIYAIVNKAGTAPNYYDESKGYVAEAGTGFTYYGNASDDAITVDDLDGYVFAYGNTAGKQSYILLSGDFIVVDNATTGIAAHRCWLNVTTEATGNARKLSIVFGDTTPLLSPEGEDEGASLRGGLVGVWFSLDGRRLDGKPTKKGVFINNNRKVVVE